MRDASFQEISLHLTMSLYVSDPKMWEQAFKDLSSGKINPYL